VTFTITAPAQYGAKGGKIEVRTDSTTGPLLGATDDVKPMTGEGAPTQVRVSIAPTAGVHDVYFVVRNEDVKNDQMLLVLLTATFEGPR
jgi:cytochrome c